jgi:hypothetical protein
VLKKFRHVFSEIKICKFALAIFIKKDKITGIYPPFLLEPDEPKQAKDGGGGGGRARRAVFPGGQNTAPEKEQNRKPHQAQVQPGPIHSSQVYLLICLIS